MAIESERMIMPRPDEVTDEMVAGWNANLDANPPEGIPPFMLNNPKVREVMYAGNWLGTKLKDAGVDDGMIERITFASGQKMVFADDPWDVAREALDTQLAGGEHDEPDPELAERLVREHLKIDR